MKVDLFIPCFIDVLYPNVGIATLKVLKYYGCEVKYNPKQTCCGQPAFNSGYFDEARKSAEYFYKTFSGDNLIVAPSGSCVSMVKIFYNSLLPSEKHKNLAERIFEVTDFLYSKLNVSLDNLFYDQKIALHEACHLSRELKTLEKTKALLKSINGLELAEFKDKEECCGFGGTFSVKFNKLSVDMGKDKIANVLDSGCNILISTDSSCLMHLESIAKKLKVNLRFMHVIELIYDLLINSKKPV